ncbi:helix-turn-helix domain-containing protein [Mycobacteroides abscessus]|uniref:helix-turn-helix domain-containing protein n=1 Tax=Mycobacteroides abscessus TaxID=36809 RepID=UPI003C7346F7
MSRRCLAKWHARWVEAGPAGLLDHSSAPNSSPGRTDPEIEQLVESLRRQTKYGAARLSAVLRDEHRIVIAPGHGAPHLGPQGHQPRQRSGSHVSTLSIPNAPNQSGIRTLELAINLTLRPPSSTPAIPQEAPRASRKWRC